MSKLLLMSVLIVTMAIPMWTAGDKDPRRGAKRTRLYFGVFTFLWTLFVAYFYARWTPPVDLSGIQ